jgi:hypothetical protein
LGASSYEFGLHIGWFLGLENKIENAANDGVFRSPKIGEFP